MNQPLKIKKTIFQNMYRDTEDNLFFSLPYDTYEDATANKDCGCEQHIHVSTFSSIVYEYDKEKLN